MLRPSGFGTQPFGTSPFGVGYRDVVLTVGRGRSRTLRAAGRSRTLTVTPREE